jgi:hypothetical protein
MYYLLGMDDRVGDLDALTAVRMFLLYAKDWQSEVAERVKTELQNMRAAKTPTNYDFVTSADFAPCELSISHCEMCDAREVRPNSLRRIPSKRLHACVCTVVTLSPGIDVGDGGLIASPMVIGGGFTGQPWCARDAHAPSSSAPRSSQAQIPPSNQVSWAQVVRKCVSLIKRTLG